MKRGASSVAGAVAMLVTLAACSGDDDGGGSSGDATTTVALAQSVDLSMLTESLCVTEPLEMAPPTSVSKGPEEGEVPGPLNSGDPALDVVAIGATTGGCGADATIVFVEFAGSPQNLFRHVAIDADPAAGRTPSPLAPTGMERVGGWEQRLTVEPDGTTRYVDGDLRAITAAYTYQCSTNVCAFALPLLPTPVDQATILVQAVRRDLPITTAPRDWTLATRAATP